MLRLIVSPSAKPGCFAAHLDGVLVVEHKTSPVVAAARRLLELGHDPATLLTMRHAGSPHDSFVPMSLRRWATVGNQATFQAIGEVQGTGVPRQA